MHLFKKDNKEKDMDKSKHVSDKNSKAKSRILIAALVVSVICNFSLASSYDDASQYEEKYNLAQEQIQQLEDSNEAQHDKWHAEGYSKGKKAGYNKGYDEAKEKYALSNKSSGSGSSDYKASSSSNDQTDDYTESTVYITNTGNKYHNYGCQYLSQSSHAINLSSAQSQGYTPCSRCF